MVHEKRYGNGLRLVVKEMQGLMSVTMGILVGTGASAEMDEEDGITLPFTYFGKGIFENMRISFVDSEKKGNPYKAPTLLFDIKLDNVVPEEYHFDFEIPEEIK